MPQTEVALRMTVALAGQIGDLNGMKEARVATARSAEDEDEIPFGVMVCRGTADGEALNLHTSAATMAANNLLLGVVTLGHGFAEPQEVADTDGGGLLPTTSFGALVEGPVWVIPEDNVTPASDVRVRVVTTGDEVAGAFRAAQDSTDCVDISAFARWITSATGGQPALLWIDMTHVALATADV